VLHAEANAITKLARGTQSSDGSTLYVTLSPCYECSKLIIQSGIRRVVFSEIYRKPESIAFLAEAGIEILRKKQ
jgi:dCMP deaminase